MAGMWAPGDKEKAWYWGWVLGEVRCWLVQGQVAWHQVLLLKAEGNQDRSQVNIFFYKGINSCFQKFQLNLTGSVSNKSNREFTLGGKRVVYKIFIGPQLNLTPKWLFLVSLHVKFGVRR